MNETTLTLIVVVLAAGGLGIVMRMFGSRSEHVQMPPEVIMAPGAESPGSLEEADDPFEEDLPEGSLAITLDGYAFMPGRDSVHVIPPGREPEAMPAPTLGVSQDQVTHAAKSEGLFNPHTGGRLSSCSARETLGAGDLAGARVVPGDAGEAPWVLEALGRDGDYKAWAFDSEDAAREALGILERIVRAPLDDDGEPAPPDDAAYQAALHEGAMTVAELAVDSDPIEDTRA